MKIISNNKTLRKIIINEKKIGFVPTMGALHQGHISLIKRADLECDKSIVSIFVNKYQFNKKKDYKKYPKNLKKDLLILKKLKVDIVFLPQHKEIYPNGVNNKIKIGPLGKILCGKFRPGHFKSVVDVVYRFIKIIKPYKIYFGEKDMQQLLIIKNFIKKNKIKVKVVKCKTIREKSGIPCSSRNSLLTFKEKLIAARVYRLILNSKNKIINKSVSLRDIKNKIYSLGVKRIDYFESLNNKNFGHFFKYIKNKIFIAYYLGSTRLIDNI